MIADHVKKKSADSDLNLKNQGTTHDQIYSVLRNMATNPDLSNLRKKEKGVIYEKITYIEKSFKEISKELFKELSERLKSEINQIRKKQ